MDYKLEYINNRIDECVNVSTVNLNQSNYNITPNLVWPDAK